IADRLRRSPLQLPTAAVLSGIEVLLRAAEQWQQAAHSGVSLEPQLAPLSALVVRWRRLELRSWHDLLAVRERAAARRGRRWWLRLHGLLT
ncbi:unnamed protein product, partial [Phaeothamnion confervicola]